MLFLARLNFILEKDGSHLVLLWFRVTDIVGLQWQTYAIVSEIWHLGARQMATNRGVGCLNLVFCFRSMLSATKFVKTSFVITHFVRAKLMVPALGAKYNLIASFRESCQSVLKTLLLS